MEIRHLRYFVTVARELNFTRAAAALHVSVPPLSQRIRDLERELGEPLFERTTHYTRLTAAGDRLLPVASRILADVDRIPAVVADDGGPGRIRIAVPDVLNAGHRRRLTGAVRSLVGAWTFEVRQVPSREMGRALVDGAVDLAFSHVPSRHPEIESTALYTDPLVVVTEASHFPDMGQLRLADLADFTLVGGPAHWDLFTQAERDAATAAGIRVDPGLVFTDAGGLLTILATGRRFALLPTESDLMRALDPAEFTALPLEDAEPIITTRLLRRRNDDWLDEPARVLARALPDR